jgi:hypothetical protein
MNKCIAIMMCCLVISTMLLLSGCTEKGNTGGIVPGNTTNETPTPGPLQNCIKPINGPMVCVNVTGE